MAIKSFIYRSIITLLLCLIQITGIELYAQTTTEETDSIFNIKDLQQLLEENGELIIIADSLLADSLSAINEKNILLLEAPVDTTRIIVENDSTIATKISKPTFVPNSAKATWLAAVFPGGGQIYNRKYWKLPIIYGGFVGCSYALSWNNKTYKDYSQAYLDIMDDDPNTNSYQNIFSPNYDVEANLESAKEILRKRKDTYRRYRDLSIFAFIGVYIISIIDAYVDAELSDFDISKDLGLKIEPAIINDKRYGNSYGLQCSIKF